MSRPRWMILPAAAALLVFFTLCPTLAAGPLTRHVAEFNFGPEQIGVHAAAPNGGGGDLIYNKTLTLPPNAQTLFVTISTTGDTHDGDAAWFTASVNQVVCNPGDSGAGFGDRLATAWAYRESSQSIVRLQRTDAIARLDQRGPARDLHWRPSRIEVGGLAVACAAASRGRRRAAPDRQPRGRRHGTVVAPATFGRFAGDLIARPQKRPRREGKPLPGPGRNDQAIRRIVQAAPPPQLRQLFAQRRDTLNRAVLQGLGRLLAQRRVGVRARLLDREDLLGQVAGGQRDHVRSRDVTDQIADHPTPIAVALGWEDVRLPGPAASGRLLAKRPGARADEGAAPDAGHHQTQFRQATVAAACGQLVHARHVG